MELSPLLPIQGLGPAQETSSLLSADGGEAHRIERAAKDFESVLLQKVLEQMGRTIGEWGFEQDGTTQQVQGMFWSFLAQSLADHGGLGLWRQIEQAMTVPAEPTASKGVDQTL